MTTFINPRTNTFNCNYPLLHERGLAPPPQEKWLKGVIKDFLPGNPDWHHYIPDRMRSFMPEDTGLDFDVSNLQIDAYFGGIGLGYTGNMPELELCNDPENLRQAGKIIKKVFHETWDIPEEKISGVCANRYQFLTQLRHSVFGGIFLKYEYGKVILKTSDRGKKEVIEEKMKKFLTPPEPKTPDKKTERKLPSWANTPDKKTERKLPSWAKVAKPYQPPSPETYITVELDIEWPSL